MPDQQFRCATCGEPFVWTAGEQRYYRERGLQPPRNCPACRRARREGRPPAAHPTAPAPRQPAPQPLRHAQHLAPRRRPSPQRTFGAVGVILAAMATGALTLAAGLPPAMAWVLGISVVTFLAFGYDKAVAGAGPTRVPEVVLLGLALIGGTLGAMLGMLLFNHKVGRKTTDFRIGLAVVAALQLVAAATWVWFTQS